MLVPPQLSLLDWSQFSLEQHTWGAATFPELYPGAVTSAEAAQLSSVSHSSQIPITSAPCLQEGLLTPSPAVILLVLSSSLLSKTLKEILNSPGGRTSGMRFSQLEK